MAKPKVAFYWCASCGGCEESVVDLAENILSVVEAVDIVLWPVALDFKYKDIEAMEDGSIAVSFINGGIRMSEQEHIAKLLRKKSGVVIAFGSCSHLGGVPGLANFFKREDLLNRAYKEVPSINNPQGTMPQEKFEDLTLPKFYDSVKALNQVIDVDYYLPGCPPNPDLVLQGVQAILEGKLPAKGSVIASAKSLCETCPRKDSRPEKPTIKDIKRPHEILIDPEKCFLDQGLICMGPASRSGCGERCIKGNMPCRGCMGPTQEVMDQGGKMLSAIGAILDTNKPEEIRQLVDKIGDIGGIFYRYSLPSSLLGGKA